MKMPQTHGGYRFTCDLRDTIASEVCFTGRYEPQETALLRALLKPGMTFVDVGANWGYFTLLAAHLVGSCGHVISLEPDPRLFELLRENLTHNDLDRVTALQVAAAAQPGLLALTGYDEQEGNFGLSRLARRVAGGRPVFSVVGQTLDALFDQQNLATVDLLKMDIEGAEGLALSGLAQSLGQRRVKRLLLELHPIQLAEQGHSCTAVLGHLRHAGYQLFAIDHSPVVSRRAAYAAEVHPKSLLRPLGRDARLDHWPHVLCTAPGMELLP